MFARLALVCLGLAPWLDAQVVEKVNGPIVGDVSRFTWSPDGRTIVYGAERNTLDLDVVTCVRISDGAEALYDPYASLLGSAHVTGFVTLPARDRIGVRFYTVDAMSFPPAIGEPLHILAHRTALPIAITGARSPTFLDDGRMVFRTSSTSYRGPTFENAWSGRWDREVAAVRLSPPQQPDNHVSLVLPALRAGVAVFGWRDSYWSSSDAELLAVPIDGGTPVALTPPPPSGMPRRWVDLLHVRSRDELVIYTADEAATDLMELWAVPIDGSLAPRRLNPPLEAGRSLYECCPPVIAPDESRIVYAADLEQHDQFHLWSSDLDSGASVRLSGPLVAGGDVVAGEFWISPDSTRVVYRADARVDELFELFSAPLAGGAPAVRLHAPLPPGADALEPVLFTPDGSRVVFAVRLAQGVVLASAPSDASHPAIALNWPFPPGGGLAVPSSSILPSVALTSGGHQVFFLGKQTLAGPVELYSAPLDGCTPPLRCNAPLVPGGNVTSFVPRPSPGAVLYRADQDLDNHFELYLSTLPDHPPPHSTTPTPTRTVTRPAPF